MEPNSPAVSRDVFSQTRLIRAPSFNPKELVHPFSSLIIDLFNIPEFLLSTFDLITYATGSSTRMLSRSPSPHVFSQSFLPKLPCVHTASFLFIPVPFSFLPPSPSGLSRLYLEGVQLKVQGLCWGKGPCSPYPSHLNKYGCGKFVEDMG